MAQKDPSKSLQHSMGFPSWLRRRPALLSATIREINRLRRIAQSPRHKLLVGIALALATTITAMVATSATTAHIVAQALTHPGVVIAVAGLYAAWLVPLRRRAAGSAHAGSWLVATPHAPGTRGVPILAAVLRDIVVRWFPAALLAMLVSTNTAITVRQSLTLLALFTVGVAIGAMFGALLGWRKGKPRYERSRYARRPNVNALAQLSADGLSRWPISQALTWARPENARLLLAASILTIPGGVGPVAGVGLLASWVVASYLGALLLAFPRVARAACNWLRSTPIAFWALAWPLARRMLLHQLVGTFAGVVIMLLLGTELGIALYIGTLWLSMVGVGTFVCLADCYRARSYGVKVVLSVLTILVTEQRWRGWGIALAMLVTAVHIREGMRYARARN